MLTRIVYTIVFLLLVLALSLCALPDKKPNLGAGCYNNVTVDGEPCYFVNN